jgi:hypothetical protein
VIFIESLILACVAMFVIVNAIQEVGRVAVLMKGYWLEGGVHRVALVITLAIMGLVFWACASFFHRVLTTPVH